jgi:hypothetical protein
MIEDRRRAHLGGEVLTALISTFFAISTAASVHTRSRLTASRGL